MLGSLILKANGPPRPRTVGKSIRPIIRAAGPPTVQGQYKVPPHGRWTCGCGDLTIRLTHRAGARYTAPAWWARVNFPRVSNLHLRTSVLYSSIWIGYSCYLSAARCRRGRFFSPIESGPGGSGLWKGIEINTGYSCYLSAARRRGGRFFLLLDLGPGAAACGMGIKVNTGYSCYC